MVNSRSRNSVLVVLKESSTEKTENEHDQVFSEPGPNYGNQKWPDPFLKFLSVPTKEQRDKMRVPTYTIIA